MAIIYLSDLPGSQRVQLTRFAQPQGCRKSSLIWSCFRWGLSSSQRCHWDWWALTPPFHPYPDTSGLLPTDRDGLVSVTLSVLRSFRTASPEFSSGTLLCEVRTFLPLPGGGQGAIARSVQDILLTFTSCLLIVVNPN